MSLKPNIRLPKLGFNSCWSFSFISDPNNSLAVWLPGPLLHGAVVLSGVDSLATTATHN